MDNENYNFPTDRKYDRVHHMWALLDGSGGQVQVGIDALGLASLGELAYITLREEGTRARRGDSIGTLEAAKMTGDFLAPVSGLLVARNSGALNNPNSVNEDPYGGGWLVRLEPEDWKGESTELVGDEDLAGWVNEEIQRYIAEGWIE